MLWVLIEIIRATFQKDWDGSLNVLWKLEEYILPVYAIETKYIGLQVAVVFAIQSSLLRDVSLEDLPKMLTKYVKMLRAQHASLMEEIAATHSLPYEAEEALTNTLIECSQT